MSLRQVAGAAARGWPFAAAALLGMFAVLALSGPAHAVGESVQPAVTDVAEGDAFAFTLVVPGVGEPQGVQAHVSCPACGNGWTTTAITGWKAGAAPGQYSKTLVFPTNFPGATSEPKWPQTYTIDIVGTNARADVRAHLVDDWRQPNATYAVTDPVHIQVAGVPSGQLVAINITKWTASGSIATVATLHVAGVDGKAAYDWRIPREHAADMGCNLAYGKCRNYTVTATVAGRTQRDDFRAQPAELTTTLEYIRGDVPEASPLPVTPAGRVPAALHYNRTENVTISVDVRYHNGARLQPLDRTEKGSLEMNGTLQVAVESVTVATDPLGNQTVTSAFRVDTLYATWSGQAWRASWNIPRNLTVTGTGANNPQYRIVLPAQQDKYGNLLPQTNATSFRVDLLKIQPRMLLVPQPQMERLANITVLYTLKYADGTPFTNTTNTTTMTARLVNTDGDDVKDCIVAYLGNGLWSASVVPGMGFSPLGLYRVRLDANTDNQSNDVQQADTEFFDVLAAKPRVDLATKVRFETRNETRGFERGDQVSIEAFIRYADGTPFNTTRLPLGTTTLQLNVTQVDTGEVAHATFPVTLRAADNAGRWTGTFTVAGLNASTPLGPWRWSLPVADIESPPNFNESLFVRWVRGAPLSVEPRSPPLPQVRAGEPVVMTFEVRRPDHVAVRGDELASGLYVQVSPWANNAAKAPVARVYPVWNPDAAMWVAAWQTNRTTIVGDYVLTVEGQDVHGNIVQSYVTRPLNVFVDRLQRQVLREPAEQVHRGEVALVVFDGAQGDIGEQGSPAPRIEVQKWNGVRGVWEKEYTNVRVNDTDGGFDHIGRLETDSTTNVGLYRFALFARNDQQAVVNATTRTFVVMPIEVQREWLAGTLTATAPPVVKGTPLTLQLQRQDGDLADSVTIFRQGDRISNASALAKPGRFDVVWRTSFALADGAYQVIVRGKDVHNNTFATPPLVINVTGIPLLAKVPAPPEPALKRAQRFDLRALVQYPDSTAVKTGAFTARFVQGNVTVDERDLTVNRSAWLLTWIPPAAAPLGHYRVLLGGTDALGNTLHDAEVYGFTLGEGLLQRTFTVQRNIANRTDNVVWALPANGNDTEMHFFLQEDSGTRRELKYNVTRTGDYVVTWKPAKDEKLTRYTLQAEGSDATGNAILATSRSMVLQKAPIGAVFLEQPQTLNPGEQGRWVFQLQYSDGTPVPNTDDNAPQLLMIRGGIPVDPLPELKRESTSQYHWVASWSPVKGKHTGIFQLAVGGHDVYNNAIQEASAVSRTFRIDQGFLGDIMPVPGFEPLLLPLAALGAALVLRRKKQDA